MSKSYIDIGHADRAAILWIFEGGKIRSYVAGDDTHESTWGIGVVDFWRGRYDKKTNELSIVAPVLYRGSIVPEYVMDALEAKFGTGFEIWQFNPKKQGRKVR